MHQTTVRFGRDLWQALEREAAAAGVSVAQFVRESAVARLAQNAAGRALPPQEPYVPVAEARSRAARADAAEITLDSAAVWSQSQQARLRSRELRDQVTTARTARTADAHRAQTASARSGRTADADAERTADADAERAGQPRRRRANQLVASDKRPPA
jgi:hypothetical protein